MSSLDSSLSTLSSPTTVASSKGTKPPQMRQACVRVLIIRQVIVTHNGNKVWRNSNIGQGVVEPLPPPHIRDIGTREESLDWKGHVKCQEDVNAPSFNASSVHVKVRRFCSLRQFRENEQLWTAFHLAGSHTAGTPHVALHRAQYQHTYQVCFRLVFRGRIT